MALVLNDRVKETTTTTGTSTVDLAGAETGFESFVAGIGNSNTCYYAIVHQTADEFEVGLGTVTDATPDTLSRTTIISSSNSDSAVNFSSGTKDVFCTLPASKAVFADASNNINLNADGGFINFIDNGTTIGYLENSSNNFVIRSNVSDADMIFTGTDGGSGITALTFDMSAGGDAIFGGKIQADGALKFNSNTGTPEFQFFGSGTETGVINLGSSNFIIESKVSDKDIIFKGVDGGSDITALTLDMSEGGAATFNSSVTATYNGTYQGTIATSAQFGTNGWINDTNGTNRFYFTASGGATYLKINSYIYFQDTSGNNRFSVDSSGNGVFAGNVTAYGSPSDIRLKENVEVIDNALDKVKQLKGITYDLKSDGNRLTGLIAQDLEEVLPEAVYTEKDIETEEEHLAIRYGNTVGLLVEAIKEQQEQIEALTAKVKELEDK